MKMRIWIAVALAGLVLGSAALGFAATYYIDDNSNVGDVYTPGFTGNDANNGLSPTAPKLTLNNLLASTNLLPGDVVFIDTGTYATNVVIGTNVNGAAGNPIVFQGSTNFLAGGAKLTVAVGVPLTIRGKYLNFNDLFAYGYAGTDIGISLNGGQFCTFERVYSRDSYQGFRLEGTSNSNAFRRCAVKSISASFVVISPANGNLIENCVLFSDRGVAMAAGGGAVSNLVGSILRGAYCFEKAVGPNDSGSYNILYSTVLTHYFYETLAELQHINTNWHHNTVADPKFVNAEGFDFHLLSAAGFVSNGVWVTNPAVGYSPGIDLGPRE